MKFIRIGKEEIINVARVLEFFFDDNRNRIEYWFIEKPSSPHYIPFNDKEEYLKEKERVVNLLESL